MTIDLTTNTASSDAASTSAASANTGLTLIEELKVHLEEFATRAETDLAEVVAWVKAHF